MESKIRLALLYPTRLTCKITHSSSSERLCQYQSTTKASWGGYTRLNSALVRFPRFLKKVCAGPRDQEDPPHPAPPAQLLSGPAGSPGRLPPPHPVLSGPFSTPITRRWLVVGFSPRPLPSQSRALLKRDSRFTSFYHPARDSSGLEGGPGGVWKRKREGYTKPSWPTAAPLPVSAKQTGICNLLAG